MEKNASCFPLFVDLYGRRCVIVGGGAIAARRAAVLGEFGAAVTVIAPEWKGGVRNIDWVHVSMCREILRALFWLWRPQMTGR